ncbi:precorrin-4/cobalt-precorrin-4 C11-methyltransferase [Paucidesulfovibrio gracilis DSM 16080]|uniref:Precorrin-4/cobalt-precorrin-4 C11-methyltransferase n=1 Tax=Paucidesulfovibrio gracilis DSM 16080 TaxID=1121449 RepID=A0A1T4X1E6_9BACT|nr:precorrin-4 C(11)-methyltransferase [Paucidesulfovibrio gracilis]SKA83267.1 precorrin-4/cobalt-precorrin-4 C11-methyltransferase [Paucidesulfovibrio gracilis DSM 16080]
MNKVYFVGAGPGDPDLITVKGRDLIRRADLVLYAGSLVPRSLVEQARPDARVVDSSALDLGSTHDLLYQCVSRGGLAVRLHTGDPSLYGATREQMELLDRDGIAYEVVPGVTAAFAAAAVMGNSFTVPEQTQTLIITRRAGRTPVPDAEQLPLLAAHHAAMAVYLSAGDPEGLQAELLQGGLDPSTPCAMSHRVGWPGEKSLRCRLDQLAATARENGFDRQTVFLILPGENAETARSKLYDAGFSHMYRKASCASGDCASSRHQTPRSRNGNTANYDPGT